MKHDSACEQPGLTDNIRTVLGKPGNQVKWQFGLAAVSLGILLSGCVVPQTNGTSPSVAKKGKTSGAMQSAVSTPKKATDSPRSPVSERLERIEKTLEDLEKEEQTPTLANVSVPASSSTSTLGAQLDVLQRLERTEAALQQIYLLSRLDRIELAMRQPTVAVAPMAVAPAVTVTPAAATAAAPAAAAPAAAAPVAVGATGKNGYKVMAVTDGGTITGTLTVNGKIRPPKTFKVEKTPEVCGKEDRLLHEVLVTNGNLQDAVVLLEEVKEGKPYDSHVILGPPPGTRDGTPANVADYPGTDIRPLKCTFGAFTGVIAEGSVFRFDNLDPVKHSPHTYAIKGRVRKSMHNQDLEGNGKLDLTIGKLKKGYEVVKLECDQHPHMQNWFRVVRNPYYAFSGEDGAFKIDQVPPGKYNLIAWHPILGENEKEVTVAANGQVNVSFEFKGK